MNEHGYPPIDREEAEQWLYPTNYEVREYQRVITERALFQNTLVCLPTGLGKTLIASVVMHAYYKWFPTGIVVFLAPTKPLVSQQVKACHDVMGIPAHDTAHLEGSVSADKRERIWYDHRVFFCTPQTMSNDLSKRRLDPKKVVCVVFDEAHKATQSFAYTTIVDELVQGKAQFRVLALSATPGSDIRKIQQVIDNLRITHIEIRTEDDPDVTRYVHEKTYETIECDGGDISGVEWIRKELLSLLQPVARKLYCSRLLDTDRSENMNFLAVERAQANLQIKVRNQEVDQFSLKSLSEDIAELGHILECREQLMRAGPAGLVRLMAQIREKQSSPNRERNSLDVFSLLTTRPRFIKLLESLQRNQNSISIINTRQPKICKLREVLEAHFQEHDHDPHVAALQAQQVRGQGSLYMLAHLPRDKCSTTRVIVFANLRATVQEIVVDLRDVPGVRASEFIGQSTKAATSDADAVRGQNQRQQAEVLEKFNAGFLNVLVATSIAEEGLDIVEVDLIVLFDAVGSPIRFVQRCGRTGRKRDGRVVVLTTKDSKDVDKAERASTMGAKVQEALRQPGKFLKLCRESFSPRMLPVDLPPPVMSCKDIDVPEFHSSQVGGHAPAKAARGAEKKARAGNDTTLASYWGHNDGREPAYVTANVHQSHQQHQGSGRTAIHPAPGHRPHQALQQRLCDVCGTSFPQNNIDDLYCSSCSALLAQTAEPNGHDTAYGANVWGSPPENRRQGERCIVDLLSQDYPRGGYDADVVPDSLHHDYDSYEAECEDTENAYAHGHGNIKYIHLTAADTAQVSSSYIELKNKLAVMKEREAAEKQLRETLRHRGVSIALHEALPHPWLGAWKGGVIGEDSMDIPLPPELAKSLVASASVSPSEKMPPVDSAALKQQAHVSGHADPLKGDVHALKENAHPNHSFAASHADITSLAQSSSARSYKVSNATRGIRFLAANLSQSSNDGEGSDEDLEKDPNQDSRLTGHRPFLPANLSQSSDDGGGETEEEGQEMDSVITHSRMKSWSFLPPNLSQSSNEDEDKTQGNDLDDADDGNGAARLCGTAGSGPDKSHISMSRAPAFLPLNLSQSTIGSSDDEFDGRGCSQEEERENDHASGKSGDNDPVGRGSPVRTQTESQEYLMMCGGHLHHSMEDQYLWYGQPEVGDDKGAASDGTLCPDDTEDDSNSGFKKAGQAVAEKGKCVNLLPPTQGSECSLPETFSQFNPALSKKQSAVKDKAPHGFPRSAQRASKPPPQQLTLLSKARSKPNHPPSKTNENNQDCGVGKSKSSHKPAIQPPESTSIGTRRVRSLHGPDFVRPVAPTGTLAPPAAYLDDPCCLVCLDPAPLENSPIILCDGPCQGAAHTVCCGYENEGNDSNSGRTDTWYCDGCHATEVLHKKYPPPKCCLCGRRQGLHGLLRMTTDGRYAHPLCCVWVPELAMDEQQRPCNLKVHKDRFLLTCNLCGHGNTENSRADTRKPGFNQNPPNAPSGKGQYNAIIQCAHGDCLEAFHPFCAYLSGHLMVSRIALRTGHSSAAPAPLTARGKPSPCARLHSQGTGDFHSLPVDLSEDEPELLLTYELYCRRHEGLVKKCDQLVTSWPELDLAVERWNEGSYPLSPAAGERGQNHDLHGKFGNRGEVTFGTQELADTQTEGSFADPPKHVHRQRKHKRLRKAGAPESSIDADEPARQAKLSNNAVRVTGRRFVDLEAAVSGTDSGDSGEESGRESLDEQLSGTFINDGAYTPYSAHSQESGAKRKKMKKRSRREEDEFAMYYRCNADLDAEDSFTGSGIKFKLKGLRGGHHELPLLQKALAKERRLKERGAQTKRNEHVDMLDNDADSIASEMEIDHQGRLVDHSMEFYDELSEEKTLAAISHVADSPKIAWNRIKVDIPDSPILSSAHAFEPTCGQENDPLPRYAFNPAPIAPPGQTRPPFPQRKGPVAANIKNQPCAPVAASAACAVSGRPLQPMALSSLPLSAGLAAAPSPNISSSLAFGLDPDDEW